MDASAPVLLLLTQHFVSVVRKVLCLNSCTQVRELDAFHLVLRL